LKGFIPGVEGESEAVFRPVVVLASDFDAAQSELAALREELAQRDSFEELYNAAIDERDAIQQRLADAERRNVDQSSYLRECQKRINVNQHHTFCLALDDFINEPEEAKS
jgi:hypothetical protein